jgi:hypothetical protein
MFGRILHPKKIRFHFFFSSIVLFSQSCQSYVLAKNVKYYGFQDVPSRGQTAGPARGEECTWMVFGHWLGGPPTASGALGNMHDKKSELKYLASLSSETDGFEISGIVGRRCLILKGAGYK